MRVAGCALAFAIATTFGAKNLDCAILVVALLHSMFKLKED